MVGTPMLREVGQMWCLVYLACCYPIIALVHLALTTLCMPVTLPFQYWSSEQYNSTTLSGCVAITLEVKSYHYTNGELVITAYSPPPPPDV